MTDTTRPEVGYIEELERALEYYANHENWFGVYTTGPGLEDDWGDPTKQWPDGKPGNRARAALDALPQLLTDAKLGQMVREAGPTLSKVHKIACDAMCNQHGTQNWPHDPICEDARAVLRTLKEMSDER